ncbi:MAG: AAA family ATPase, partial [Negativicutes bacterium]|nr:AAA family ATPase [Negativicutes bacterium]
MRLNSLHLINFKCFKDFRFEPLGENCLVMADNGVGKSTLADAWFWLLFGRNSLGQADFSIQPIDPATKETIHRLQTTVEGVLDIDGKQVMLKKLYAEKWVRPRGKAVEELDGHPTTYYINGDEKSKRAYEDYIASIIRADVFPMLTNPLYFNDEKAMETKEMRGWQRRRNILMEIGSGEGISDADVIDSQVTVGNKDMLDLLNVINAGRTLDDHRRALKAREKEIDDEQKKIPGQIEENQRSLADVPGIDAAKLPPEIADVQQQLTAKQQELARAQAGGELAEKKKQLALVDSDIIKIKNEYQEKYDEAISQKRQALSKAN